MANSHAKDSVSIGSTTTNVLVTTGIVNTTTANVNSGATVLAGVAGKQFVVTGVKMRANGGAASGATLVRVMDGTNVIFSTAIANLASAVWVDGSHPYQNGAVLGTNFGVACTAGGNLTIDKTGSSLATATSVDVIIDGYWV